MDIKKKITSITLIIVFTAAVFFAAIVSCNKGNSSVSDPFEYIRSSAVKIESGTLAGSGNIWEISDDNLTVITALHVIDDLDDIEVTFCDGSIAEASLTSSDEKKDICFLTVELAISRDLDPLMDITAFAGVSAFAGNANLQEGESVLLYNPWEDSSYAGFVADTDVYVEDFTLDMIYCMINADEGMSGCGLFDTEGNYLGILLGGTENGEAFSLSAENIIETLH